MTILGGLCLLGLSCLAKHWGSSVFFVQATAGMCLITAAEFATGLVVNLSFGWQVGLQHRTGQSFGANLFCAYWAFTGFCLCFIWFLCVRAARKLQAKTLQPQTICVPTNKRGACPLFLFQERPCPLPSVKYKISNHSRR